MRQLASVGCLALATCASGTQDSPVMSPIALRNAGFESAVRPGDRCPVEWSCTMHSNPDAFRFALDASNAAEGRQSLCIERVAPEPWAVISQSVPARALRGHKLRYSIAMRGERLLGPGAGPWLMVIGAGGMITHEERVMRADGTWQRASIELVVPAQADAIELGATLQGAGRACIDDVRLEASGAPAHG